MTITHLTKKQTGIGGTALLAAGLSLLVMAAITANGFKQAAQDIKMAKASAMGQQLKDLSDAMNTYMVNNYAALACGSGGTCASVAGVADKYHPTITELKAAGVLDYSVQATSVYNTGLGAQVVTVPTGCAGSSCSLSALVYTTAPVIDPSAMVVEGSVLGKAILAGGADVGASITTGNVNGLSGTWSVTNPVTGSPAGILAARSGTGSAFDPTAYLRRDGTLPMTGNLDMNTKSINNAATVNSGALNTTAVNATTTNSLTVNSTTTNATTVNSSVVKTGTVQLNSIVVAGAACSPNGLVASDASGSVMSCTNGLWVKPMSTCRICRRQWNDGDAGQCNPDPVPMGQWDCASVEYNINSIQGTIPFRDDTDGRGGGCYHQWALVC